MSVFIAPRGVGERHVACKSPRVRDRSHLRCGWWRKGNAEVHEQTIDISLRACIYPEVAAVSHDVLRTALYAALEEEGEALTEIESFFRGLARATPSRERLARCFNGWKATHLKMLAIYGLSCRLQLLAETMDGDARTHLLLAAARNAETSHEDLGLDFDGETHSALYDELVAAFLPDDSWTLGRYSTPSAQAFKGWVYRNMVVEPILTGLLTNLFSEIYNHAEYTVARAAFTQLLARESNLTPEQRARAMTYIDAHVDNDTEINHFALVLEAIALYCAASGREVDPAAATALFRTYLRSLGEIMSTLHRENFRPSAKAPLVNEVAL
jgi:hypothetical protein